MTENEWMILAMCAGVLGVAAGASFFYAVKCWLEKDYDFFIYFTLWGLVSVTFGSWIVFGGLS